MLFGSYSIRRKGTPPIEIFLEPEYIFLCSNQFTVTPYIVHGDPNLHTFEWIFLSGAAVNIVPGLYPFQLVVEYATIDRGDVFMRLMIDRGTSGVQTHDIVISGTPRSTLYDTGKTALTSAITNPTKMPSVKYYSFEYDSSGSTYGVTDTPIGYMMYINNPTDTTYLSRVSLQQWNTTTKQWDTAYLTPGDNVDKQTVVIPYTKYRFRSAYDVTTSTTFNYATDFFYAPDTSDNNRFAWSTVPNEYSAVSEVSIVINIPTLVLLTYDSQLESSPAVEADRTVRVITAPPINVTRDSSLDSISSIASSYTVTYFGSTTIGG